MSLPFDEQLKVWAAIKYQIILQEIESVTLEQSYDEGYTCCGGTDPGCYCSMATGASLNLVVTITKKGRKPRHAHAHGDFAEVLDQQVEYIDMLNDDIGPLVKEIYEAHFP